MSNSKRLHLELNIPESSIQKTLTLIEDGATVPFIARYRKDITGGLDEVQILNIKDRNQYWIDFFTRQQVVLESIENQGLLTEALKQKILSAESNVQLEDLYLPYRPKRKTKGQKAIEQGLKPLAIFIQKEFNDNRVEDKAFQFVRGEIKSVSEAIDGALSIIAEWISEISFVRERMREQFDRHAVISSKIKKGKDLEAQIYKDYFEFSERIQRIAAHRTLALLRGEKEGYLNIKITVDEDRALENLERWIPRSYARNEFVKISIKEAYKRILQPAFESEFKKLIKDKADIESINVFAGNLEQLLLQSPLGHKNTLAIDPGFKTGCKVAILNKNGDFIEKGTIFPHPPQRKLDEAEEQLSNWIKDFRIETIAVGDGTAGIETLQLCRKLAKDLNVQVFSVNEAGASIYSASVIAREEFPGLDLTVRGAISIGRRLMDPLAELVKIDPKSIGVGQYQHDVNQPLLKEKLGVVVERCVNYVGVDLNSSTFPILTYISGLGPSVAKNIVEYRKAHGDFKNRKELLKVPKLGQKAYEQAAGFLRIEKAINILDDTRIHPESYHIVKEIANSKSVTIKELFEGNSIFSENEKNGLILKHGLNTVNLVLNEIDKPTRDPRTPLESSKENHISSITDLKPGMILNGVINNITNFGAFVNLGIKESGLVHVSQISNTFIKDIQSVVKLNQQVNVKVIEVDLDRKRIQLTMKDV